MTSAEPDLDRFRALLRVPTVSREGDPAVDPEVLATFQQLLVESYPLAHENLEREVLEHGTLLYRWKGAGTGAPSVLMAHQDVVPADEDGWEHPAFDATLLGEGEERRILGRGTLDDKGMLVAILEAVENSIAGGYRPAADVYLLFGADEEVAGRGVPGAVEVLRERGIHPALVLDEGGAVVRDVFPGVKDPIAVVGITEKGIASVELSVEAPGGHASTPAIGGATAKLARAILRLEANPAPSSLDGPTLQMVETLAPHVRGPLAPIFRRARSLRGALAQAFARLGPETAAMVRTTRAVTRLRGSAGDNVIAERATAMVNVRVAVGSSLEEAVSQIQRVVARDGVTATLLSGSEPSPVSRTEGEGWDALGRAIGEVFPEAIVTPYVMMQASDARHVARISENVYRFLPYDLRASERATLHAIGESIRVDTWRRAIEFFEVLLRRL